MTIADQFSARVGDDGQVWRTDDGVGFDDLAQQLGANLTYSAREIRDGERVYVDGWQGGHIAGDPVRYEFPDGSAIVAAGDGWGFEGPERYSWAG